MESLSRHRPARAGFSLVDVCIALSILAIALGTLVGSVFWALRLEEANEETAAASQQMRALVEHINATPFGEIYSAFNADKDDDPDPDVDRLAELATLAKSIGLGSRTPPVISVSFPGDELGELREDVVDEHLGLPRDLNGDGDWDTQDHAADYTLLPLTLRLDWDGASGPRTVTLSTLLRNP